MDKSGYIAVVGGINMDIQGRCFAPYIAGDSNPGEATMSPGGVGRNIAENLVRLGLRTELVTVLGDDTLSAELALSCGKLGIGIRGALRLSSTPASQYLCIIDGPQPASGSAQGQTPAAGQPGAPAASGSGGRLIGAVACMSSFERLTPQRLEERSGLLDGAALVIADANLPAESLAWLAGRYGRGRPAPVLGRQKPLLALDPVSTSKAVRAQPIIGAFDFVKPNRAEAEVLSGVAIASNEDLPRAVAALHSLGTGDVFISLGADGLYYEGIGPRGQVERGIVKAPPVAVVNVSGAGDAAFAALAWGLVTGKTIAERAAYAVAAAALATTARETVSPEAGVARLLDLVKGVAHEPLP